MYKSKEYEFTDDQFEEERANFEELDFMCSHLNQAILSRETRDLIAKTVKSDIFDSETG